MRWDDLLRFDAQIGNIGQTLTVRATSYGLAATSAPTESITFNGGTERELVPGYLNARRDSNDVLVSWQGVGRLGSGAHAVQGSRFAGYRVTVTDGTNSVVTDTAAQSHTQDVTGWSSPVTVRVSQVNALAGAGPYAEVSVI